MRVDGMTQEDALAEANHVFESVPVNTQNSRRSITPLRVAFKQKADELGITSQLKYTHKPF